MQAVSSRFVSFLLLAHLWVLHKSLKFRDLSLKRGRQKFSNRFLINQGQDNFIVLFLKKIARSTDLNETL